MVVSVCLVSSVFIWILLQWTRVLRIIIIVVVVVVILIIIINPRGSIKSGREATWVFFFFPISRVLGTSFGVLWSSTKLGICQKWSLIATLGDEFLIPDLFSFWISEFDDLTCKNVLLKLILILLFNIIWPYHLILLWYSAFLCWIRLYINITILIMFGRVYKILGVFLNYRDFLSDCLLIKVLDQFIR